jgi:hypothetical protein
MQSPFLKPKLTKALFLIREALILVSDLSSYDYMRPGLKGNLTVRIIKKKYPKKI